jgi:hypothetical protein
MPRFKHSFGQRLTGLDPVRSDPNYLGIVEV